MKPFPIALALAVLLGAAAGSAAEGTRVSINGMTVSGGPERFEVFARAGASNHAYFCAAADFARFMLGARATERVEVTGAIAPSATRPGLRSAVFRLAAPGAPPVAWRTARRSPWRTGDSVSIAFGTALCNEFVTSD